MRYCSYLKMENFNFKSQLIKIFLEFVAAVNPAKLIGENLELKESYLRASNKMYNINDGKIYLVGFGKAALGMASRAEKILGSHLASGVICVPENSQKTFQDYQEFSLRQNSVVKVFEGAKNNMPDEKAERGAEAIIELVQSLNKKSDILIVLISGGGSALFPKPKCEIKLEEKLKTITYLSSSGANIVELNTVRKKLSEVKGGGLAKLSYPAKTISFILSDVLNDPIDIIASGPCVPNFDKDNAALEIIEKYNLLNKIPESVLKVLKESYSRNSQALVDNCFPHVDNFLIGNNIKGLKAAKQYAEAHGFKSIILSSEVNGYVQEIAAFYCNLLLEIVKFLEEPDNNTSLVQIENNFKNCPFSCQKNFLTELQDLLKKDDNVKNICVIAGGETTVKLKGNGKGGRNQELALFVLMKIHELKTKYKFFHNYDIWFLSGGSDGIDGPTDAAGAVVESNILEEAVKNKLNVSEYLENNDSYNFYSKISNGSYLIKTGHTGTNVADMHILAIYKKN